MGKGVLNVVDGLGRFTLYVTVAIIAVYASFTAITLDTPGFIYHEDCKNLADAYASVDISGCMAHMAHNPGDTGRDVLDALIGPEDHELLDVSLTP